MDGMLLASPSAAPCRGMARAAQTLRRVMFMANGVGRRRKVDLDSGVEAGVAGLLKERSQWWPLLWSSPLPWAALRPPVRRPR
ncbi:hypothetical protein GCM10010245_87630 [Streptomyces spectabilis]|nr:hypothetical protein GCM10010245_87630 [Streptomyces spectabilis]